MQENPVLLLAAPSQSAATSWWRAAALLLALVVGGGGTVVAQGGGAGQFGARPANPSTASWRALGTGINGIVRAMAASGSDLYVGGSFDQAGRAPAKGIAKWDGQAWSALGGGVTSANLLGGITAIAVVGTDVYVAGDFTEIGGVPAAHIAKWNGQTWSALGSGIASTFLPIIKAIAVVGPDVYVGGSFTQAGGVPASGIARWDGQTWSAPGGGLNGAGGYPMVDALLARGTDLYVGGAFRTAGNTPALNVARWDGSSWSSLGAGIQGEVDAFVAVDTILYAAGRGDGIFQWRNGGWSLLTPTGPAPYSGYYYALAELNGQAYAAGGINFMGPGGGYSGHSIVRVTGGAFTSVVDELGGIFTSMAVLGNELYVGGFFQQIGGLPITYIARTDSVSALGVAPEATAPRLTLWPNPVTTTVQVQGATGQLPVQLYDAIGRLLLTMPPTLAGTATLPLAGLTPGLYTVRCGAQTRRLVRE